MKHSVLAAFLAASLAAAENPAPAAGQPAAPATEATPVAAPADPLPVVKVDEADVPAIRTAAEAGDAAAQVKLGHYFMDHYEEGYANEKTAGEWFRRAAESGDAEGQAWYAVYLLSTTYPPSDGEKAARPWAEKAAEQGSALGGYLMGMIAHTDVAEERIFWLQPAAEKGFVPAMRGLALAQRDKGTRGWGSAAARRRSKEWLAKAIPSGDVGTLLLAAGYGCMSSKEPLDEYVAYAQKAIESARARDWRWYDTVFDFDLYCRRYVAGGARWYQLIRTHQHLEHLYRFMGKAEEAEQVPARLVAILKEEAAKEPLAGNYVLAELFKNWSWLYFRNCPCPEDYKPYAQRAAECECTHYYDYLLRDRAAKM